MKRSIAVITAATMVASVWTVRGALIVLGPTDATTGPIGNGSAPINTTTVESKIGSGAWQANGTATSQYYLYYNGLPATQRGLGQLTVSDLASLSFSTFNSTTGPLPDWYLTIYTAPYVGGEASWYGNRLVLEPYLANNILDGAPAGQWNKWSTAAGNNQLTINDTGGLSGNIGFYGQPTLANVQAGSINWAALASPGGSATPVDYSNMNIMGIVLSTGNPWANGFTGLVDEVTIDAGAKGSVTFDLEGAAVPEPSTYIAGALLLLPFGASTLRVLRNKRAA